MMLPDDLQSESEIDKGDKLEIEAYKQALDKILNLSRLYSVLSRVNELIVRTQDREELFTKLCRIVVEEGKFLLAWIGIHDQQMGVIKPVARYGLDEGYLEGKMISSDGLRPEGLGPTGIVTREGGYFICNDIGSDPLLRPWRNEALKRGFRSMISLALESGRKMIGTLTIYSETRDFFTDEELKLLITLVEDISFAIETIDLEKDHVQRELMLVESENHYRSLFEHSVVPIWIEDFYEVQKYLSELSAMGVTDFRKYFTGHSDRILHCASLIRVIDINETSVKFFGKRTKEEVNLSLPAYYFERSLPGLTEEFVAIAEGKKEFQGVITIRISESVVRHLDMRIRPAPGSEETLSRMLVSWIDITARLEYEQKLRRSQEEIRDLARHIETVRENERRIISMNLHDDIGQVLTALKMDIAWLRTKTGGTEGAIAGKLGSMSATIDNAVETVQKISSQLRPSILYDLGLRDAVEWQLNEFTRNTGIQHRLDIELPATDPAAEISIVVYRILQEALTNVARHSGATSVEVVLSAGNDMISLNVKDNGKGMDRHKPDDPSSLGLLGIRERARAFHGTAVFESARGSGTTVSLSLPLTQAAAEKDVTYYGYSFNRNQLQDDQDTHN
ncbi:MAG: GAF domain-containing sensor histidine kinase [Bacteroidales bacterium]|jgi:signal transduction histidine kinase|nr:GAF domain-containing sensor histidine kinase [Bacteroidales bacterium]